MEAAVASMTFSGRKKLNYRGMQEYERFAAQRKLRKADEIYTLK